MSRIELKLKPISALLTLLLAAFVALSSTGAPEWQADQAPSGAIAPMEAAQAAALGDRQRAESSANAGDIDQPDADDPPAPSRSDGFVAPRHQTHVRHSRADSCPSRRCTPYHARAPPLL